MPKNPMISQEKTRQILQDGKNKVTFIYSLISRDLESLFTLKEKPRGRQDEI
jgi:hypothetical protein